MDRPASDVSSSIAKMETDEIQLLDRLQREQAQTSGKPNFQRLLSEASEMRQAQDDEIRLEGQKREQLRAFASAKQRLQQSKRMLEVIKSCAGKPIEKKLDELDSVFESYVLRLEDEILPQRRKLEMMLLQAEKGTTAMLDTPENDTEDVNETATQLDNLIQQKKHELASMNGLRGDTLMLKRVRDHGIILALLYSSFHLSFFPTSIRLLSHFRRPMMQSQNWKPYKVILKVRHCSRKCCFLRMRIRRFEAITKAIF